MTVSQCACVAALVGLLLTACQVDPTASGGTFHVRNDTPRVVAVDYCDNSTCAKLNWTEVVAAGGLLAVNTAAEDFDEWYRFSDQATHDVLGCKTVDFHGGDFEGVVVNVSSAAPCRPAP